MERLRLHSRDFTKAHVARLADLFPHCVTEAVGDEGTVVRRIDFDLLRQELSDYIVESSVERYQLTWPGKQEAILAANAPIAKTLRPDRADSVDFDNTRNLFIEGNNLDALKLLQETYLGEINVIYIDPPYNTGKEMVYSDDYGENTAEFLRRSNQLDDPERGWIYASSEEMQRQIALGLVEFRDDHTEPPIRKAHLRPVPEEALHRDDISDDEEAELDYEPATQVRGTYFYKQSQVAVRALRDLMGAKVFNNPKDHQEIARLIDYVTAGDPNAVVMDFFAGSGTTAHSVWDLNAKDGGCRRFILVQLPEPLDPKKSEQRAAAEFCDGIGRPRTIAELAKERLRRAGQEYASGTEAGDATSQMPLPGMSEEASSARRLDVGFRVLKVDTSNMEDVYYRPGDLTQDKLFEVVENIKPDRTPEDLLFQIMLDLGVDLTAPIAGEDVAGKQVFFVAGSELAACFEKDVTEDLLRALADRKPARVVFRDAGFASDDVKINAEQIFKLLSPSTELRVI